MKKEMNQKHRQWARERLFLLVAVLTALFFLMDSPENLNSITAAAMTGSFTENNYFLAFMLFLLTLIFALYVLSLIRRSKIQVWHPEQTDMEETALAEWDSELPLDEKIDQLNRELKNLMKDQPRHLRKIPRKITKIPNIKEIKLKEELDKIQNKIHGYSAPLVLQMPKNRMKLEKDLINIKEKLQNLDSMEMKKARFREEVPSRDSFERITDSREILKKELDHLHVKMHNASAGSQENRKGISKEVLEINKKIAELENMPIKKVKIRTEIPKKKRFTDMPAKERLKHEFSEISEHLTEDEKAKRHTKVKYHKKKKSKTLQEIEEKLAELED